MRPGDPLVFAESVAAVFSQYPLALVRECVDPRTGIARVVKFLSIAELVTWLDDRLAYYVVAAAADPRDPPLPLAGPAPDPEMAARVHALLRGLGKRLAARAARGDIIMRRRRVYRYLSERRLRRDRARALADLDATQ